MTNKRLFFLFELYLSKQANDAEKAELMHLLTDPANEEEAKELLGETWKEFESEKPAFTPSESKRILNKVLESDKANVQAKVWRWSAIFKFAAVLLLVSSAALLWFKEPVKEKQLPASMVIEKKEAPLPGIAPGGNKAILTLANGTQIALNDLSNGKIANESGLSITKVADGQLIYTLQNPENAAGKNKNTASEFNTISTPRGGQYQVNLPDGSKVWLNSASSLKFPTAFLNHERKVELIGEAYFEISPYEQNQESLAFKVISSSEKGRNQEVKVLGTHFNIQAYGNENAIKTTLLEGRVQVTNLNSRAVNILSPGQQAILNADKIKIAQVNLDEVMAWKNGNFMFNNMSLNDIMKQLERWYDVEVNYDQIPDTHYHGFISRQVSLSQVLDMLELTGNLKFRIERLPGGGKTRIEIREK